MPDILFKFSDVAVLRPNRGNVLSGISWEVRDGETWAIVGPNGSGKTTLGQAIVGRLPTIGEVAWPLIGRLQAVGRPVTVASDVARFVGFREESSAFSYRNHYYQERFNFTDPHEDITLREFLRSGTRASDAELQHAANQLGVGELLDHSFLTLSNGQTRRARIAKAVLTHPALLVLDDPFVGLDASGRATVSELIGGLVRSGTRVVLITDAGTIPEWVTHVLEMLDGQVASQERRASLVRVTSAPSNTELVTLTSDARQESRASPILELRNVTVAYGGLPVLDRVSWTVRAGERWALLGPNGSGKSTLLSLTVGDHPQVYANNVSLFGRRRGTGETIWDVKRNVGLLSPELHLYFNEPLTAEQTVATGFVDAVAYRRPTPEQALTVRERLAEFGLSHLASRPFSQLSTGEQRLVLLVRAIVKRPALLILDEPFQGLDSRAVQMAKAWLDSHLGPEQALVFVTHYPAEIPSCVNRVLRLEAGRVTSS